MDQERLVSIPANLVHDVIRRHRRIYVWGRVDYVDAFDKPRHFTFKCGISGRTRQIAFSNHKGEGWGLSPYEDAQDAN